MTDKRDDRVAELAAQAWGYVWQAHKNWIEYHKPAKPGEPCRFAKDEVLDNTDANDVERDKLWTHIYDVINSRKGYFFTFIGNHRGYDIRASGAFIVTNVPELRITKDLFIDKIDKGMFKARKRRAIRMTQVMGEQEYIKQLDEQGANPKILAIEAQLRGNRFPDEIEVLMLESGS